MQSEAAVDAQDEVDAPSSRKSQRGNRWLTGLALLVAGGVFFWLMAHHALLSGTVALPDDTEIKVLGGFTGRPSLSMERRPMMTVSYDITVRDESFAQQCKDVWNRLHTRLPSWAKSKIKTFPSAKETSYGSMKPQVLALTANKPIDFAEWSITVKESSGHDVPSFNSSPPPKPSPSRGKPPTRAATAVPTLPLRLLQGEYPSDSRNLTLRFEFRGIRRKGPDGTPLEYPVSELTINNPFYGHRPLRASHSSTKGLLGSQRITTEHFRLSASRTELLQEVTFRIRCEPWRDADDGMQVWDATICNPAGGWDAMPVVQVKRLPAEQAQEIVCRVSGWPSTSPLRVRFWLSPRFSHGRPPSTSFEFKQVMVPAPGLGQPQNMTARSGNKEAMLMSAQNRAGGAVSFRLKDWAITPQHECTSWYLRDAQGNTAHPETGAEYRAWEEDGDATNHKHISFGTNLPTHTKSFDIGLTEVKPEMVELEFPPETMP